MNNQSTAAVAIRWFLYGAILGAVVDIGRILAANADWQRDAGGLATTLVEFAIVGMLLGLFRHHLAKR
jgi:hypothetical protein